MLTYAFVLVAAMTVRAPAQQSTPPDDAPGGFLAGFLEDTFSGDNRAVRVVGLEGALSSRASIREIHVSDDRGEWLTLTGVVLDWNRAALLRGRFSVNELTAQSIEVIRRPVANAPSGLPSPEAVPFALPDLPVSVDIGKLAIKRVTLQKPVLGVAATLDLSGALTLADGALDARLGARRLDRSGDALALTASYANDTRQVGLNLRLRESAGGLIATALAIPGTPQITLTARGDGPVTDFAADVRLSGNGAEWLSGRVALQGEADDAIAWFARLQGDIRPMLPPRHGAFFGPRTRLDLSGRRQSDGRFSVDDLTLSTHALSLSGKLSLSAQGRPELVALTGKIGLPGGDEVLLPIGGARTSLRGLEVNARFDASTDRNWRADLTLDGLKRADLALARATVTASGIYAAQGPARLSGRIESALSGLVPGDPDLSGAIGRALSLTGDFALPGDGTLRLSGFALRAKGLSALADLSISGLNSGYRTSGDVTLEIADLARFSGLAGRDLGGDLRARLSGSADPLGGGFDLALNGTASDLRLGDARIDPLLAGQTRLKIDAARGATGVEIRTLTLAGESLDADISGTLRSAGSDLAFSAVLSDLGRVLPDYPGKVTVQGSVMQDGVGWRASARLDAPEGSFADLTARLAPDGPAEIDFNGEFARLQWLLPDFPGTLKASGQARRDAGQWRIDATMSGPADINATLGGSYDEASGRADATATGRVELAAANRMLSPISVRGAAAFDLTLKGQPGLPALSGRISTSGASVALPLLNNAVENLTGAVALKDGRANVDLRGRMRSGGGFRVSGPISLSAPFDAGLSVDLQAIGLTDNVSFKSTANGQLSYTGPLAGNGRLSGRIDIGKTEIDIGATGGGVSSAPIPPIIHRDEPSAVRVTRRRAGLIESGKATAQGPEIGLDVVISAPSQVYVRGRGLESELGGEIRLRGTTNNVIPAGQIELIRGTLEIFGRRLELSKGLVTMQGSMEPYLDFAATSSTGDGTATLEIKGVPTALEISATSSPERPPEEALAMVVFGNQFSELSPLKIAQLAGSLARLRGGGDPVGDNARRITGADSVSVGEDDSGNAQAEIGAHLGKNVYTDLSVNTKGDTEVNINLDVSRTLTLKGTVDNAGNSAVGIFFERDY